MTTAPPTPAPTVSNREHPPPPSATLPHRGTELGGGSLQLQPAPGAGSLKVAPRNGPLEVAPGARSLKAARAAPLVDSGSFGVYVHVPFCLSRCHYCDFVTYTGMERLRRPYTAALLEEAALAVTALGPEPPVVTSVFVGGGTPTLLPAGDLARVLGQLRELLPFASDAEVTVEANPETVDTAMADGLAAAGVTRASMGAQSFDDRVLAALGRRHDAARVATAVATLRAAGVPALNLDLIYGGPGEDAASWSATLEAAVALGPEHLSAYALTIEPATRFGRLVASGRMAEPDEDDLADRYATACATLADAGYRHYEVSNWAKDPAPGRSGWPGSVELAALGRGGGPGSVEPARSGWAVGPDSVEPARAGDGPPVGESSRPEEERRAAVHSPRLHTPLIPTHASRHNLTYWRRGQYLGLGAGAHEFLVGGAQDPTGNGVRRWNLAGVPAYLEAVRAGRRPTEGEERLDPAQARFEAVALRLRTADGLDPGEAAALGIDLAGPQVEELRRAGLLASGPGLRLTEQGMFLHGEVVARLA